MHPFVVPRKQVLHDRTSIYSGLSLWQPRHQRLCWLETHFTEGQKEAQREGSVFMSELLQAWAGYPLSDAWPTIDFLLKNCNPDAS